ncbi:GNAT family N-acetyltransferase [Tolypothrix bouteillei VB521301_2]|uniref:GNAT family N-acetyltransferase n=1 Tax=Tolypothrix bouteillei VB521301 TaxID=1479485 RepID=A0A8S9SXF7_9CYAN|nr:GNAT family N-acetyltransferase [Tolypothrix bouteillei]KAF3884074.1 GNAT family N-acetyltransferase [Tolypothrix bouteillei VB521301]
MEFFAQTLSADPGLVGWWGWDLVLNEIDTERVLIGCAGFNGYPDTKGNLLLGYCVLDDYQGKGYATEAVGGLLSWAFEQPQVV